MSYQYQEGRVSKIVDFIKNNLKLCFLACTILFLGLAPGVAKFKAKYDVRIWFLETDPLIKTLDQFEKHFGNDESLVVILHSSDGLFNPSSMKVLKEVTEKMWKIPEVIRVETLSNFNYTYAEEDDIIVEPFIDSNKELTQDYLDERKAKALSHEIMPGYLVSKDGKSAMMFARLATTLDGSPDYEVITREAQKIADEYSKDGHHQFHLVGQAPVNDAFRSVANHDAQIILPCLFALIIIYLLFVFRSFMAMVFPLAITFLTVVMTLGICFYIGFEFNSILSILPAILIAIAIADSVHILVTYFQLKGEGEINSVAAYKALHKNFIPTLLTSLSTMIGFLSLTWTDLSPIRELGILSGIGCLLAWIITIFMMGPMLFWIDFKTPKHFADQGKEKLSETSFSWKVTLCIDKYKNIILVFFISLGALAGYFTLKNRVNSNPFEYFTETQPLRIANDFVVKEFGGNTGPELLLNAGKENGIKDPKFLAKVEKLKNWIDSQPYVTKTIDIINILKDTNRSLHGGKQEYYFTPKTQEEIAQQLFLYTMSLPQGMDLNNQMTLNYDMMRLTTVWDIYDTRGWLKHVDILLEKVKEFGLDGTVTGKFYLFQRMMDYVVLTFVTSISMALVLVAVLMMILFKSVKIGLLSLVPNILPLLFGGGLMYLVGIDLNIGSALVASVCLGIAVDDTIHFLSNYYRLKKEGVNEKETISSIIHYTGSALIVTTIILASGFGLYLFGDFVPNVNFGLLCSVVLTMALIVDLVFLPAMLMKIDEIRNKKAGA